MPSDGFLFFFSFGVLVLPLPQDLNTAIEKCTTDDTLQTVDAFILKVIQLYEGCDR